MAKYTLKRGKHYLRDGTKLVLIEPGDVIELTDTQAKAFADRFEPVEPVQVASPARRKSAKTKTAKPPEPEPGPWDEVAEMNANEVKEFVTELESVDDLTALGDAEAAGRNRKSIFTAITARIEQIEATATGSMSTASGSAGASD